MPLSFDQRTLDSLDRSSTGIISVVPEWHRDQFLQQRAATNSTLVITNMQWEHAGEYRMRVTYGQRTVTSEPAYVGFATLPQDWRGSVSISKGSMGTRLTWDGCGTLEYSSNLLHWVDVPANPLSPYDVSPALDGSLFYRLRR